MKSHSKISHLPGFKTGASQASNRPAKVQLLREWEMQRYYPLPPVTNITYPIKNTKPSILRVLTQCFSY